MSRKKFVEKKLLTRVRLFAIISLLMIAIGIYNVTVGYVSPLLAIAAFGAGIMLGLLVGRASNVVWHEETGKAISKMDRFGVIVLVCYIVFAIFRKWIFQHWLTGHQLSAFIICFSAGIMLGRFLTLRSRILKLLNEKGL
ncbi:MAG: hypothetical protein JWQ27_2129 [Ferruginibacter sp.]|nr:hypothetical protein [Ferruginibacter sp.]